MDTNSLFMTPLNFVAKDAASTTMPTSFSVVIDSGGYTGDGAGGLLATGVVALGGGAILPKYVNATGTMTDLGYSPVGIAITTAIVNSISSSSVTDITGVIYPASTSGNTVTIPIGTVFASGTLINGVAVTGNVVDSLGSNSANNIFAGIKNNEVVPRAYVDAQLDKLLKLNDGGTLDSITEISNAIGAFKAAGGDIVNHLGTIDTHLADLDSKTDSTNADISNLKTDLNTTLGVNAGQQLSIIVGSSGAPTLGTVKDGLSNLNTFFSTKVTEIGSILGVNAGQQLSITDSADVTANTTVKEAINATNSVLKELAGTVEADYNFAYANYQRTNTALGLNATDTKFTVPNGTTIPTTGTAVEVLTDLYNRINKDDSSLTNLEKAVGVATGGLVSTIAVSNLPTSDINGSAVVAPTTVVGALGSIQDQLNSTNSVVLANKQKISDNSSYVDSILGVTTVGADGKPRTSSSPRIEMTTKDGVPTGHVAVTTVNLVDALGNNLPVINYVLGGETFNNDTSVRNVLMSLQQQLNSALYGTVEAAYSGPYANGGYTSNGVFTDVINMMNSLYGIAKNPQVREAGSVTADLYGYTDSNNKSVPGFFSAVGTQSSFFDTLQQTIYGKSGTLNYDGTASYTITKTATNNDSTVTPGTFNLLENGMVGMVVDAQADATNALKQLNTLGITPGSTSTPTFNNGINTTDVHINPSSTTKDASLYIGVNWRFYVPPLLTADDVLSRDDDTSIFNTLQLQFSPTPLVEGSWVNASQYRAPRVLGRN